jgi:hypothetical protein
MAPPDNRPLTRTTTLIQHFLLKRTPREIPLGLLRPR